MFKLFQTQIYFIINDNKKCKNKNILFVKHHVLLNINKSDINQLKQFNLFPLNMIFVLKNINQHTQSVLIPECPTCMFQLLYGVVSEL